MKLRERNKAVIYVTCARHVLVFREPDFPEVGVQPPGGTINPGEDVCAGAMRELAEETGIVAEVTPAQLLGEATYEYAADGVLHRHHRSFFHVEVECDTKETWQRWETNPDGADRPILFQLFWTPLSPPPVLFAELGVFLGKLKVD